MQSYWEDKIYNVTGKTKLQTLGKTQKQYKTVYHQILNKQFPY